jgi:FkbM family methyltransferase
MLFVKKRFLLSLAVKYKIFYKIYLYYNIYIRNFKYIFQKSYSQFNEDIFIKKFFKNKNNGIYIDIGCHHPFKLNNTYLLYKSGWMGINVDLIQLKIDLFNIARPKDKNICCAISNKNENSKVYIPGNNILSAEISIDKTHSNLIKKKFNNTYSVKKTTTLTFKKMLKKFNVKINNFDFLKLDIEGKDYEVLRNINLEKYNPKLICIEDLQINNKNSNRIKKYLISKNYRLCFKTTANIFFSKTI